MALPADRIAFGRCALACALACVTLACPPVDDPGGSEDDAPVQPATCPLEGSDAQCDPYDQVNFLGTQATALCSFLFDCCSGVERNDVVPLLLAAADSDANAGAGAAADAGERALDLLLVVEPALLTDELACVRALALAQASSLRDDVVALLDEAGARRTFDRDAAAVCIGQIEEAAALCAPALLLLAEAQPPECGRIFAPAVAEGGVCTDNADCLDIVVDGEEGAPALCFALDGPDGPDEGEGEGEGEGGFDVSLSGSCTAVPEAGEACPFEGIGADVCAAGTFCSSALVCLPVAAEGEPCGARPCGAGLRCLGVCAPLVPSGVDPVANGCALDSDCLAGLCVSVAVDTPDGPVVVSLCADPPVIDPLAVRFDFCLDERGNASLGDVIPEEQE